MLKEHDRRDVIYVVPALAWTTTAAVIMLWRLEASGVTGNALRPRYANFGWFAYAPMPAHPTRDDFRRAGVTLPQDRVARRRRLAGLVAGAGVAASAGLFALGRRHLR